VDTPRMSAWCGIWKKQRAKRSELDLKIDRKIEAAASKMAEMFALEPNPWKRRRFVRAARRFTFNAVYARNS